MFLNEHLSKKWEAVVEHPDLPQIKDNYRKAVTTVLLEPGKSTSRRAFSTFRGSSCEQY